MIVIQGSLEGDICGLGEHTLLLKDGKDPHWLEYKGELVSEDMLKKTGEISYFWHRFLITAGRLKSDSVKAC